jgi:hypothetical protein
VAAWEEKERIWLAEKAVFEAQLREAGANSKLRSRLDDAKLFSTQDLPPLAN